MKNKKDYSTALLCAVMFGIGCAVGSMCNTQDVVTDGEKPQISTISSVAETRTEIAYVPKKVVNGKREKADIVADIGKKDITVKVNGKEHTFVKSDEEKYVFDKNKLTLDQTSRITLDMTVPTVDNTKRWAIGVGASDNGIAYTVDFPIGKSDVIGGWVYKSNDEKAIGIKIKF